MRTLGDERRQIRDRVEARVQYANQDLGDERRQIRDRVEEIRAVALGPDGGDERRQIRDRVEALPQRPGATLR